MQLSDYSLVSLQVFTNLEFKEPKEGACKEQLGIDFDFGQQANAPIYRIDLKIQCNFGRSAFHRNRYRIKIGIQSIFEFEEGYSEEDVPKLLIPNGLAITYSLARGIVSQATAQCKHGKFILPTVNFMEIFRKKMEKEKHQKES
jgi:preprotein translocase subunit SecB